MGHYSIGWQRNIIGPRGSHIHQRSHDLGFGPLFKLHDFMVQDIGGCDGTARRIDFQEQRLNLLILFCQPELGNDFLDQTGSLAQEAPSGGIREKFPDGNNQDLAFLLALQGEFLERLPGVSPNVYPQPPAPAGQKGCGH